MKGALLRPGCVQSIVMTDKYVCLSDCLSVCLFVRSRKISKTTRSNCTKYVVVFVHVDCNRGSAFRRRRCDT